MAMTGSGSSTTTFTITRTNDGKIVISIGSSYKEYSETVAKITIKTKFDGEWTGNY